MIEKFPFNDNTIQDLAFLDHRNSDKTSLNGFVRLANRYVLYSTDELDTLNMEFRDYRASSLDNLPKFDPKEHGAIDHFWAAMAKLPSVMDVKLSGGSRICERGVHKCQNCVDTPTS